MGKTIKNAAVVNNVVDVSLLGTADLAYWQAVLKPEQLEPIEHDGRAQVLIITADARYMGLRFRELSFAVFARDASGLTELSGSYLIRAFNSRRSFAWIERTLFKTPYYYGDVQIEADPPKVMLQRPTDPYLARASYPRAETPGSARIRGWHGPVFLPSAPNTPVAKSHLFFAQVRGETTEFPYDAVRDQFTLPTAEEPPFSALRESQFRPLIWSVRPSAMHAKSKTYSRGKCPPFVAETFD